MKEQRPDSRDVERVRELLNEAAPQDTRASYRAESVVRRGRRARTGRGVASALAVGVAAAAVIIGPAFIDSSPVTNEATGPSNDNGVATGPSDTPPTHTPTNTPRTNEPVVSHPDPYLAHPCPASPVEVPDVPDTAFETLGPDAAMVRLCRARVPGYPSSAWDPPADALVIGVDGFAAQVAELPAADPDPCPAARPVPQPFALQITDSAGATQTLGSALTACGVVTINSRLVSAEALLATFGEALVEQRATLEPAVADTTLECQGNPPRVRPGWMSEITSQTRFIAATTCATDVAASPAIVPPSGIELLNQEWAAHARDLRTHEPLDVDRCPAAGLIIGPTYVMTTWGDVVPMRMVTCGNYRIGSFQLLLSERLVKEMSLPYQPGLHWTVPGD